MILRVACPVSAMDIRQPVQLLLVIRPALSIQTLNLVSTCVSPISQHNLALVTPSAVPKLWLYLLLAYFPKLYIFQNAVSSWFFNKGHSYLLIDSKE